jgi:hypothetical protein
MFINSFDNIRFLFKLLIKNGCKSNIISLLAFFLLFFLSGLFLFVSFQYIKFVNKRISYQYRTFLILIHNTSIFNVPVLVAISPLAKNTSILTRYAPV